jgi:hypothetical protein
LKKRVPPHLPNTRVLGRFLAPKARGKAGIIRQTIMVRLQVGPI